MPDPSYVTISRRFVEARRHLDDAMRREAEALKIFHDHARAMADQKRHRAAWAAQPRVRRPVTPAGQPLARVIEDGGATSDPDSLTSTTQYAFPERPGAPRPALEARTLPFEAEPTLDADRTLMQLSDRFAMNRHKHFFSKWCEAKKNTERAREALERARRAYFHRDVGAARQRAREDVGHAAHLQLLGVDQSADVTWVREATRRALVNLQNDPSEKAMKDYLEAVADQLGVTNDDTDRLTQPFKAWLPQQRKWAAQALRDQPSRKNAIKYAQVLAMETDASPTATAATGAAVAPLRDWIRKEVRAARLAYDQNPSTQNQQRLGEAMDDAQRLGVGAF